MNKIEQFKKELNYIKRNDILEFCKKQLNTLPNYFFEIAASSTGKYHPKYALGTGGLKRHVQASIGIAIELFRCKSVYNFTELEQDIIIAALLFHDGCKRGKIETNHTVTTHPLDVIELLHETDHCLHPEIFECICDCISSHMGQWNTNYETGEEVLPLPHTEMQKFVHLCDYLASRKCLEFNFNE